MTQPCNFIYVPSDDPYCGVMWCTTCGAVGSSLPEHYGHNGDWSHPLIHPQRASCQNQRVSLRERENALGLREYLDVVENNNKKEPPNEVSKL